MLHIGIVASSAEGAALCYRTICVEGADLLGPYNHPEVSMHGHPFIQYQNSIDAEVRAGVAELMLSSAEKLARAGRFPDRPCQHGASGLRSGRAPLSAPWLHIAVEVANEAKRHDYKRLGVLGTRPLMDGPVYRETLKAAGIEHRVPVAEQQKSISIASSSMNSSREYSCTHTQTYFTDVIRGLKDEGCDAVALACTEIPLLMTEQSTPMPMRDSTRILARAACARPWKASGTAPTQIPLAS